MSDDAKAAKDLVETLKDGEDGFASAAEKLQDGEHPEWATTLQRLAEQRAGFRRKIVALGHDYDNDVDQIGSAVAAVYRGWLSLKDALTGDDAGGGGGGGGGVLGAAVPGEDHTVSEYEKALDQGLSDGFREVVKRQHGEVVTARSEVKALQSAS